MTAIPDEAIEAAAGEMAVLDLPDDHSLDDRIHARAQLWHRYKYEAERILTAAAPRIYSADLNLQERVADWLCEYTSMPEDECDRIALPLLQAIGHGDE